MIEMFIGPLVIALREGIEAALVIAIMLSYLAKTKQDSLRPYIAYGTIGAVLASVSIAIVLASVFGILEGAIVAIFEGIVVLFAALLLTTMIFWMWQVGPSLSDEIQQSMKERMRIGGAFGLTTLTFALILREGVELVLFTIALSLQDPVQTYSGIAAGLVIAMVIGYLVYKGSLKVSLSSFFKWTSILLILFAAGMVAYGIHELQEAGFLLIGPTEIWNLNPPLLPDGSYPLLHENGAIGGLAKALLGYNGNPSALEVTMYFAYNTVVLGYYLWASRKKGGVIPDESKATKEISLDTQNQAL